MALTDQPQLGQPLATAVVFTDPRPEFYDFLRNAKRRGVPWMRILSQHSTQKARKMGGAPNPTGVHNHLRTIPFELEDHRTIMVDGVPNGLPSNMGFRATICLPNAFLPGDGNVVEGVGTGLLEEGAKEVAALQVLAQLLASNPHEVRLLDRDWSNGDAELVRTHAGNINKRVGPQRAEGPMSGQPLATRSRLAGYQAPPPGGEAQREMERKTLLAQIISHHQRLRPPEDPNPCKLTKGKSWWIPELDRLWKPGTLKQWIEDSREFTVVPHWNGRQWTFKENTYASNGSHSEVGSQSGPFASASSGSDGPLAPEASDQGYRAPEASEASDQWTMVALARAPEASEAPAIGGQSNPPMATNFPGPPPPKAPSKAPPPATMRGPHVHGPPPKAPPPTLESAFQMTAHLDEQVRLVYARCGITPPDQRGPQNDQWGPHNEGLVGNNDGGQWWETDSHGGRDQGHGWRHDDAEPPVSGGRYEYTENTPAQHTLETLNEIANSPFFTWPRNRQVDSLTHWHNWSPGNTGWSQH